MEKIEFEKNKILFGHGDINNIVSVEINKSGKIVIYRRVDDEIITEEKDFSPFILLKEKSLVNGLEIEYKLIDLAGELAFSYMIILNSIKDFNTAKDHFKFRSGLNYSHPASPYMVISDYVHQYLLMSGNVHFKQMEFKDVKRMALDIETETESGYSFPNPERDGDRIISVALATSDGGEYTIAIKDNDEKSLLKEMIEIINREDPDIIEGHNIFKFDLQYIKTRASKLKIPVKIGRDGSSMKMRNSRINIAERIIDYPKFQIFGRTIVDTWLLTQSYDVSGRDLPGYGLKVVAQYFGVSAEDREIVDCSNISELFKTDPERVLKYNLQDSIEVLNISEILQRGFFMQGKIFPYSYQNVTVRGNATKINSLLIREYLRRQHSIAEMTEGRRSFAGGYTDIFEVGVFKDILHCDVASLYPSIMMSYNIKPAKDVMEVFPEMLNTLKNFRLKAKELMRREEDENKKTELNALQTTFKILINSFYGYLGTTRHNFSDLESASAITEKGREILKEMVDWLQKKKCRIIELDTDGIYFTSDKKIEDPEKFIGELSDTLPEGIDVEYDGSFKSMFSYKKKNYALMKDDDTIIVKGSGLKSRGIEKYQRNYLNTLIRLLMEENHKEINRELQNIIDDIESGKMNIELLTKTDLLVDSVEAYQKKISGGKRNRSAVYELASCAEKEYKPGDHITYYITGNKKSVKVFEAAKMINEYNPSSPDYNIPYYKDKIMKLHKKFNDFINTNINDGESEDQGTLF